VTLDQLIAEVAAQPNQVEAFNKLMECMRIEMNDASSGNSPPPSVQSKYDEVFSQITSRSNEVLNAIEYGKPPLEPVAVKESPAYDPQGPKTENPNRVFVEKPAPEIGPDPVLDPVNDPARYPGQETNPGAIVAGQPVANPAVRSSADPLVRVPETTAVDPIEERPKPVD